MSNVRTKTVEGLLTLTGLRGIGPATAERLAGRFDELDAIFEADPVRLKKFVPSSVADLLRDRAAVSNAAARARHIMHDAAGREVRIVSVFEEDYPAALRSLTDRPPVFFVKGSLPPLRSVACIGTREPTDFGAKVSERLVETLVAADWAIVSGLAIGVDTISHDAALRAGGCTIAVMAGGLDSIYPKQNMQLAEAILERGGSLVSEQPFGVPPSPRNLVQRDRLQSGLSIATFVMQTDIKGGSMHTVRFTLQQQRLLFAPVPRGRHAEQDKSQGILALTQLTGKQFAGVMGADGDYLRLLEGEFRERSPAIPLESRDDYAAMLEALESRLATAGSDEGTDLSMSNQPTML